MKHLKCRLQTRDEELIEFLNNCKCADTKTLSNIFFNGGLRTAQLRLQKLQCNDYIKAFRPSLLDQNIYYVKHKPTSYKHAIKVSQFIGELYKLGVEVIKYRVPYKISNIIADGLLVIRFNNEVKILFLEVELTKYFNLTKYQDLYYSRAWKEIFPVFPSIVVVTDKKVEVDNKFNIIKIDTEFSNIQDLILKL